MPKQPSVTSNNEQVPADLREAAGVLLPGHRDVATVAGAPNLLRVETINGPARITRWESGATQERIAAIHATFAALQRAGVRFTPAPIAGPNGEQSITLPGHHRYEARGWLAGQSAGREAPFPRLPLPSTISVDHVAETARALGRMHQAGSSVVAQRVLPATPLTSVHRAIVTRAREVRRNIIDAASAYPPARGWMSSLDRLTAMTAETIGTLQEGEERRFVVAHGDLWPEHLLFSRRDGMPELTGLAGWSRVAASSPLLDLAQIVSRTRGWSQEFVEAVVSAYQDAAPLTPVERRALPGIVALDLMETAANLLERYILPDPEVETPYGQTQQLIAAIERTLQALEAIVPVVGGFDSPTPKRGRKWVYRTQPSGPRRPPRG
jgi:Ser/Thr protein kinase RdoA (MazF antagonist)